MRDRGVGEAARRGGADDGRRRRERVERGGGVDVEIHECPGRAGTGHQTAETRDFLKKSKCSSARPVPRATQFREFSATWHGTPVTCVSSLSMLRRSDPPPDITMPLSMMSDA